MGSVERRLEALERRRRAEAVAGGVGENEERIYCEALTRTTTEDLIVVEALLDRLPKEGVEDVEPTEEEWAALTRFEDLREEVRNEVRASS